MASPFLSSWSGYGKFVVQKRVSPLPIGRFPLPEDLASQVNKELRDYASAQGKKAKKLESESSGSEDALFFIRYLYEYQDSKNQNEYLQLSFAERYITDIVREYKPFESNSEAELGMAFLEQVATHPAIAFLTQCAVDEMTTAQAEKFLWRQDDGEEEKYGDPVDKMPIFPAFLYWMYLVSHQQESGNPKIGDLWKVWHLYLLGGLKPAAPVLFGFTADDAPGEIAKLFTEAAFWKLFSPLVYIQVSKTVREHANALVAVRELLCSFFLYCEKSFPQLKRAFPDLVNWEQMIYYPQNGITRLLKCRTCWKPPTTDLEHISGLPETPRLRSNVVVISDYMADTVFQRYLFNSGTLLDLKGVQCVNGHLSRFVLIWTFFELPRLLFLNLPRYFSAQTILVGPSLKTGQYSEYRLYSRLSWDKHLKFSAVRKENSSAQWLTETVEKPTEATEFQIYERV